jgi:hypothetical protein
MTNRLSTSAKINNSSHQQWPEWFSINHYDCLADLTVEQFLNELETRLTLYHTPRLSNGRRLTDDKKWQQILHGDALLHSSHISQRAFPAVTQLSHIDVEGISATLKLKFADDYCNQEPQTLMPVMGLSQEQHLIAVDLTKADNKTILGDIEYLLNQLRHDFGIPEPLKADSHKVNEKTFKKFFTYKVIPYLDLMLYCHNHINLYDENWQELSFTHSALIALLFNDEVDVETFKKTYAPFYLNMLTNEPMLMKLLANMRQNAWALNTKIPNL